MDLLSSNSARMMERSMEFLWAQQTAILDNIANAETPNYKTKFVTFEEAFNDSILDAQSGRDTGRSVREAIEESSYTVHEAGESVRMDENGVNVTEQSVELIRTAYQLQYAMRAISGNLSILRAAIG